MTVDSPHQRHTLQDWANIAEAREKTIRAHNDIREATFTIMAPFQIALVILGIVGIAGGASSYSMGIASTVLMGPHAIMQLGTFVLDLKDKKWSDAASKIIGLVLTGLFLFASTNAFMQPQMYNPSDLGIMALVFGAVDLYNYYSTLPDSSKDKFCKYPG